MSVSHLAVTISSGSKRSGAWPARDCRLSKCCWSSVRGFWKRVRFVMRERTRKGCEGRSERKRGRWSDRMGETVGDCERNARDSSANAVVCCGWDSWRICKRDLAWEISRGGVFLTESSSVNSEN